MAGKLEDRVKDIIVDQLGVNAEQVTPEASFIDDLGADSLDTVELIMAFEEEFGAAIPEEDAEKLTTVGKVVEAVAAQILVTPSLVKGEGELIVRLKSDVLDGSTIRLTAERGTLSVEISPATQSAQRAIVESALRLEAALSEHVAAFHHVRVLVKKGRQNEAV